MQQLITVRLDVSPLIYHQQSGAVSHSWYHKELARTHINTHTHTHTGHVVMMLYSADLLIKLN